MSIDTETFSAEVKVYVSREHNMPQGFQLDSGSFQHKVTYVIDCEPKSWGLASISLLVPQQILFGKVDLIDLNEENNPDGDSHSVSVKINLGNCTVESPKSIPMNGFSPNNLVLHLYNFRKIDETDFECDATGELDFHFPEKE